LDKRLVRIKVEGFRSLASVELSAIGQRSVLIGPNGAGKSNLLSFLRMVTLSTSGSLRRFVGEQGGAQSLLHYGPKTTAQLTFELEFEHADGKRNVYSARLGHAAGDKLLYLDEQVAFRPVGGDDQWFSLGAGHFESALPEADGRTEKTTNRCMRRLSFFHFHDTSPTSPMRANARAADVGYLRSDGSNLAAYLGMLRDSDEPGDGAAFRRISAWVRQIAPFVKALEPTHLGGSTVRLHWRDERDQTFGPEHLSDGTLRAIALFTALGQPADRLPLFVTIDEPELGLHPAALDLFCDVVHSASANCQVMLATQSPALLNHFDPGEVWVLEQRDGASTVRRLEADALASWLQDYTLAQLYDSNVLGGRPRPGSTW
jgi:predicted ATPase